MRSPVAISVGLGELITPSNPDFSMLFEALRAEGRRTQPIEALSDESLAPFGALLLSLPRGNNEWNDTTLVVQRWVWMGGAVLYIGDGAYGNELDFLEFAADLVPGCWVTGVLGRPSTLPEEDGKRRWRWDPHLSVDARSLLGQRATLAYTAGGNVRSEEEDWRKFGASRFKAALHRENGLDSGDVVPTVLATLAAPAGTVEVNPGRRVSGPSDTEPSLYDVDESWDPGRVRAGAYLYLRRRFGRGTIDVFGAAQSLSNDGLARADNLLFLQWLLRRWLPEHAGEEVRARMARPQRHRMLHGYPMAPLTPPIADDARRELLALEAAPLAADASLIVGVLPHPFCNPAVRGCGFCTFPHETFTQARAHAVAARVAAEIDAFRARAPALTAARVEALYLGGGTANLTPPDDLVAIGEALARTWDLAGAEVTLEGVPVYFTARKALMLDALERAFPACQRRLSLGVQTFDREQLARMGRLAFGDRAVIADVVRQAHARGMSASADLLFDLPSQTLAQMIDDVETAVAMGFDHVCLYHLVLFEGIGTEWSNDRSLLAALPDNARACEHWTALRRRLLELGFVQTSLTNFERGAVHGGPARFRYESCAYRPEGHDIVGFGPAALTGRFSPSRAVKLVNADGADAYVEAVDGGDARRRAFVYGPRDARVLYLTRKVVTLGFDRGAYRGLFGTDAVEDFAMDFEALDAAGLVAIDDARVALTERGMFYADTVAGLLASRQVHDRQLRARLALGRPPPLRPWTLRSSPDHMG